MCDIMLVSDIIVILLSCYIN